MWLIVLLLGGMSSSLIVVVDAVIPPRGGNPFSANYRTNLCKRAYQVFNGTVSPMYALSGMTLNALVNPDAPSFSFLFNASNGGQPYGGFLYRLAQSLAKKGGFKWNWVVSKPYNGFKSGTVYLQTYLPYIDVYMNVASDTVARRTAGVGFTDKVNDVSVILVALQSDAPSSFNIWNFLSPFIPSVWGATFGVAIANALFRWLFAMWEDYVDRRANGGVPLWPNDGVETQAVMFLFYSLGDLVKIPSDGFMRPRTAASMLLKVGYSFFVLIMLASYTANLANVFLVGKTPQYSVVSLDDANAKGQTLCVLASNSVAVATLTAFPNIKVNSLTVVSDPSGTLLRALKAGQCDGAVMYLSDFTATQQTVAANPACDIVQVGGALRPNDGAFTFNEDFNGKCTAVLDPVLSDLVNYYTSQGFYDDYFDDRRATISDQSCPPFDSKLVASEISFQLAAGIFEVYGFAALFAFVFLAVSVAMSYFRNRPVTGADSRGGLGGEINGADPEPNRTDYIPSQSDNEYFKSSATSAPTGTTRQQKPPSSIELTY